jgi:hypothetical protein
MRLLKRISGLFLFVLYLQPGFAQDAQGYNTIALNDLNAFQNPGKNWVIAADVTTDYNKPGDIHLVNGAGVIINVKNDHTNLVTKDEFGDLELEFDFMLTKGANSGIYLQGRYEIQLHDSWTNPDPTFVDCGGVNQRFDGSKGYEGTPPLLNVARAPGLWQHLKLKFKAAQFNAQGIKTTNARFIEVYLNGALVQQQVAITGPTQSAPFNDESATGPLVFQDDQGAIALKNIHYRRSANEGANFVLPSNPYFGDLVPMSITPTTTPFLQRSYMYYANRKITTAISVGYPNHTSYSYDLKEGAMFQIWRGQFLDVTDMWYARGEGQTSKPLGSVITLSDAPVFSVLADDKAAWPDSVAFDDFNTKGYGLNKQREPTFHYIINGTTYSDKISVEPDGSSITRELTAVNAPANLYCRIACGDDIKKIGKDLYAVNDKTYYIRIDKQFKPLIRQTPKGQELVVLYNSPITYSITW